jgi:hypothetical protein
VLLGIIALAFMARTLRWKQLVAPARAEVENREVEHPEPSG